MKVSKIPWNLNHIQISRQGFNRLKYVYSAISVIVDLLPGNTKSRQSTRSWTAIVGLLHPREAFVCATWVMSHIWMSHVTHMNESCHTHANESCHTYVRHECDYSILGRHFGICMCDMIYLHVWHDSSICVSCWSNLYVWHDSFVCATWLILMRDMARVYVCHAGPIYMRDMTHLYVQRDSFVCVTWLIYKFDMTDLYVRHD